MDKESYQLMTIGHVAKRGTKEELSSPFFCWIRQWREGREDFEKWRVFRERKCNFSLVSRLFNRRFSSGQEAKLFYAVRATRGHRFCGVSTTPRGRGFLLLDLILF